VSVNNLVLPVLMYHGIHDTVNDEGLFDSTYSLSRKNFKAHLSWLFNHGYQTVAFDCLPDTLLEKSVVVSFDDGDISNYTVAYFALLEVGYRGEFYITTDRIGHAGSMSKNQIRDMADNGMSIQSHGVTHKFLSDLKYDDLYRELYESKDILEQITGKSVNVLALPGGRGNSRVVKLALELGYKIICTSIMGHNHMPIDHAAIKRLSIYRDTNVSNFRSLVMASGRYYNKSLLKQRILVVPKMVLGNNLYFKIRKIMLDG